jgi:hypothetical protein
MGKGPFKMKSASHGGPMRRNFPSAFPKLDVKVGEEVFTGEEAYAKGKEAEAAREKARHTEFTESVGKVGVAEHGEGGELTYTTQKDIDAREAQNQAIIDRQTKQIEYTGDDALRRIHEGNWSWEGGQSAKRDAIRKVKEGGSYVV